MTITILPACCGCEEEIGVHRRDEGFYCDACADEMCGIMAPPDEDESDALFGARYDRNRDRLEEESLHEPF